MARNNPVTDTVKAAVEKQEKSGHNDNKSMWNLDEKSLMDFSKFHPFEGTKEGFFRGMMHAGNSGSETMNWIPSPKVELDPNDGRFDDIDDEDPMAGVPPYEKPEETSSLPTVASPFTGVGSRSNPSNRDGGHSGFYNLGGFPDFGSFLMKEPYDDFPFPSLFGRPRNGGVLADAGQTELSPSRSEYSPKNDEKVGKDAEKTKVFAYEKIPGTFRDPPEEKFKQPAKVGVITPSRGSNDPDGFLSSLKYGVDGLGMYGRGYFKKVTPMSHDTPKPADHTRFVVVSDTHSEHRALTIPDGDVLLHCGDFTESGKLEEIEEFHVWLAELPHKHKIVIAGNHELSMDIRKMEKVKKAIEKNSYIRFGTFLKKIPEETWRNWRSKLSNCTFLEDQEVRINGIRIYGSPWQPEFGDLAFNMPRGRQILEKWNKIPGDGIDILMTHGPPVGHGDRIVGGDHVGCVDLLNTVQLRVQPKYHLFGHIHEDFGFSTDQFTTYANCSSVNYHYEPGNPAFVFDLPNKPGEEGSFVGPISY